MAVPHRPARALRALQRAGGRLGLALRRRKSRPPSTPWWRLWARSSAFPRRTITKTTAKAHGQWVAKGYRPGDVLIYDFPGTAYKTDHTGICESVIGQYVTAIESNTSNGNTGSQLNGDGVYRRKRKMSLVLGAYRPKYTDYRAQLQKRAGVGGQDDGLPRGVQVRQRPDPQAGNDEIICPNRAKFKRLCPAWAQPYP